MRWVFAIARTQRGAPAASRRPTTSAPRAGGVNAYVPIVVGSNAVPAKKTSPPGSTAVRNRPSRKVGNGVAQTRAPVAAASFATNAPVGIVHGSYDAFTAPATTTSPVPGSAPIADGTNVAPAVPYRRLQATVVNEVGSTPPATGDTARTQTPASQRSTAAQSESLSQRPAGE